MIVAVSAGRDAPLELRERVALSTDAIGDLLAVPHPGLAEMAVLSTCHRTEVYATADGTERAAVHAIVGSLPGLRASDQDELRVMRGAEAVEHLFRVACGLDSLVIGESQILGQVRQAFVIAKERGAAGPMLTEIFGRALRLGRRARNATALGRLAGSLGTLAAEHLEQRLGGLRGRAGVVVGAGEAAGDAARALAVRGASLTVLSRSGGERVAEPIAARAAALDDLRPSLEASEFAIVAVAGGRVVRASDLPVRSTRDPYVVIDLSMPHAVEAGERPDVDLRRIDDLPGPRSRALTEAVIDADALVRKDVAELERWIETRASGPVIRELRARAEGIVRAEVARALGGLALSAQDAERVAAMGMRIANKLLHGPTGALRDADEPTRALIREMFDL